MRRFFHAQRSGDRVEALDVSADFRPRSAAMTNSRNAGDTESGASIQCRSTRSVRIDRGVPRTHATWVGG